MILDIARNQLGYTETGNNRTIYGKWYGLDGQPWCAMFVSWVFSQAGLSPYVAASSKKGFASCDAGLKWFASKGKLVPVGEAREGDLVFFQFDTDAQPDHVGIVEKNNTRRKILTCIEGNTSGTVSGSQSNGGGVYRKKRPYSVVMGIARPIKEKHENRTPTNAQISAPSLCANCGQPLPSGSD